MGQSLDGFCTSMLQTYGTPDLIAYDIASLADDFVQYFGLSSNPDLMELKLLLDVHHKIASIEPQKMGSLSGCHYVDGLNQLCINYETTDSLGRNEFTIMHECYEALQETFEQLVSGYHAHRDPTDLCMKPHADRFAAAVLMQPDVFQTAIMKTGLDICALRRYFSQRRSYISVALRIKELLKPPVIENEVDFFIAIYERNSEGEPNEWSFECCSNDFTAKYVVKTRGIRLGMSKKHANFKANRLPRRLFPVRDETPAIGFIIDEVVKKNQPIYWERAIFDLMGDNDMSLLARPVYWYGRIAKVILVAIRRKDSYLLEKQA